MPRKNAVESSDFKSVGSSGSIKMKAINDAIPLKIDKDLNLDTGFARYLGIIRHRMNYNRGGLSKVSIKDMSFLYSDVELEVKKNNQELSVELKIRKSDLYLIGFKKKNGMIYEFMSESAQLFENSVILGYSENYTALLGHNLQVGYHCLRNAALAVIEDDDHYAWRPFLGLIAVTLCETTRFEPIANIIHKHLRSKTDDRLPPWCSHMFRNWSTMSELALKDVSVLPHRLRLTDHQLAALRFLEPPGRFARVCLRVYYFPLTTVATKATTKVSKKVTKKVTKR